MSGSDSRLSWANALRGIAAVLVAAGHLFIASVVATAVAQSVVRSPVPVDLSQLDDFVETVERSGIDVMAAGVCIFFLLSGLVIARSLDRYSRAGFLVGRVMRIFPTYAVAYLVGCAAVALLAVVQDRRIELAPVEILGGLVPGLDIVWGVPALRNGVAWTLLVEITFYGACLLLHRRLVASGAVRLAVAGGCVAAPLLIHIAGIPTASGLGLLVVLVTPFLPLLLIGVQLHAIGRGAVTLPDGAMIAVLFATFLGLSWAASSPFIPHASGWYATYAIATAAFLVVWRIGGSWGSGPGFSFLADISYPLYVLHLLVGWALILGLVAAGVASVVAVPIAFLGVVGLSWILHVTVEAPTHRRGQAWARRLSMVPDSVADAGDSAGARPHTDESGVGTS